MLFLSGSVGMEPPNMACVLPNSPPAHPTSSFICLHLPGGRDGQAKHREAQTHLKSKMCVHLRQPHFFLIRYIPLHLGNKVRRLAVPSTVILEGESSDILGLLWRLGT